MLETPGYTPGHISINHHQTKTMICGDAMVIEDSRLMGPRPQLASDPQLAARSLQKLAAYEVEQVICYHGGFFRGDAAARIAALAAEG